MIVFKILGLLFLASLPLYIVMGVTTEILSKKPKENKFRQWWSRHIVDLDGKYE